MISLVTSDTDISSAPADESATDYCFLDLHAIGVWLKSVICPETDLRVSASVPQAASAHDTFWDFISLMPESTHISPGEGVNARLNAPQPTSLEERKSPLESTMILQVSF